MYILKIEDHNGNEKTYKINSKEDLRPLYDEYPNLEDVMMHSHSLQEGLNNIADYLSTGYSTATVESTELTKGVKSALAALGIALGAAVPTAHHSMSEAAVPKMQSQLKLDDFGSKPEDKFLWSVMQVESSGGKNLKHQPVKHGPLKGQVAMGRWGLLKPTTDEMITRMDREGKATHELKSILKMDRNTAEKYLRKNPHVETHIARYMARLVSKRYNGNLHMMAWAWNAGHNTDKSKITNSVLLNSDYVSKFKNAHKLNPFRDQRSIASVMKSQGTSDLVVKINEWFQKRLDNANKPLRDSTFVQDKGPVRDKELDKKPSDDLMEKLKQQIKGKT
jgi:hypothetical protein